MGKVCDYQMIPTKVFSHLQCELSKSFRSFDHLSKDALVLTLCIFRVAQNVVILARIWGKRSLKECQLRLST